MAWRESSNRHVKNKSGGISLWRSAQGTQSPTSQPTVLTALRNTDLWVALYHWGAHNSVLHTHSPNTGGKTIGEETFCFDSSYGIESPFLQGHFSALFCLYVMHRERVRETRPHRVAISNSVSTEIMLVHSRVETSMLCFLIFKCSHSACSYLDVIKERYSCCFRYSLYF